MRVPVPWRAIESTQAKTAFDQHRRLDFIRQKPAELDAPLFVVLFLQDLFRTGELFVACHLIYGCAEVLRRESRETTG